MPQLFRAGGQVRGDKGAEPDAMGAKGTGSRYAELHLSAGYSGKTNLIEIEKQPIKEYNKSVNNRQVVAG